MMIKALFLTVFTAFNALAANSIIALVDDEIITLESIKADIKPGFNTEQKREVVNQHIDVMLQLSAAKKMGIQPKPESITATLNGVAKQNNISLAQLRALDEFEPLVASIENSLTLRGLKQIIAKETKVALTQIEIDAALKNNPGDGTLERQIKVAQIAISSIDQTDALLQSQDALIKDKLLGFKAQLDAGESFAKLAKLHSQDPSYKDGGVSAWLDPKKLPLEFTQVLDALEADQVSEPFKIGQAWRLIKLADSRQVDKHLDVIKATLVRQKQNDYFNSWTQKLRDKAYIEIFEHKL